MPKGIYVRTEKHLATIAHSLDLTRTLEAQARNEDVARAYDRQHLACGICGAPIDLNDNECVNDHCHVTGRFRGVLHRACNLALGHLEAVDPTLSRATAYLRGAA